MSGQGDDRAERAIERALAGGPRDVLDLLDAFRKTLGSAIELREGVLHPILHRLVRRGRVLAGGRSSRGLTLYRAPETPEPAADPTPESTGPSESEGDMAKLAVRIASGVRDPAARGRVQADVHAHLCVLADDNQIQRFGSTRGLRQVLHRVDRGRPAIVLTVSAGDSLRRFLLHEGPWLFGAVILFFVLKLFIVPIYVIPSKSMLPTLQVGDRVAVFLPHIGGVPERWTIVTYEKGGVTFVKRLVGLPGEEIAILHGDVWADGTLLVKPDDVREALRSRVDTWDFRADTPRGWGTPVDSEHERTWTWRAGGFPAHPPGSIGNSYVLRDGYARLRGELGTRGELVLRLQRGPAGSVDGKAVIWTLEAGMQGVRLHEERLEDGTPREPAALLASRATAPAAGATTLELSYVDGVLRASCGDWRWQAPRKAPDAALGLQVTQRGAETRVLEVGLDRDVHYAHLGEHAVPGAGSRARNPHRISKTGVFCLGDNTTDSRDSRYRDPGDIPVDDLIGAVRLRIWPLSRIGGVR